MPQLTIVSVPSDLAADEVLTNIDRFKAKYGTPVVPIVAGSPLRRRVTSLWTSLGIDWQDAVTGRNVAKRRSSTKPELELPDLPDVIAATNGIEPLTRTLAKTLSSRPLFHVHDLMQRARPVDVAGRSVMLLLGPRQSTPDLLALVDDLTADGARIGIIPVGEGYGGRYSVIKALTTGGTARVRRFRIIAAYADDGRYDTGPSGIGRHSEVSGDIIRDDLDVLLVSGHSNPWHMLAGHKLIMCSRHRKSVSRTEELLPCFSGGGCQVLAAQGGDPFSSEALASVGDCKCRVLVLWGCDNVRFDAAASNQLAFRAWQSDALAVIGTTGFLGSSVGMHALALGLIADGTPLGEVVQQLNDVLGPSSGANNRIGPLLLFGNPGLALHGHAVYPTTARNGARGKVVLVPKDGAAQPDGCFVKFNVEPDTPFPVSIRDKTSSLWCEGGFSANGAGYMWARLEDGKPDPGDPTIHVTLESLEPRPQRQDRARWSCMADALQTWASELEPYLSRDNVDVDADLYRACLAEIPKRVRACRGLASEVRPHRPYRVLVHTYHEAAVLRRDEELEDDIRVLCERLIQYLFERLRKTRVAPFMLGLRRYDPDGEPEPGRACNCGHGRRFVRAGSLTSLSGQSEQPRRRVEYRCEACGAVDVDDGRQLVELIPFEAHVTRGHSVTFRLRVRAPDDEPLGISYGALIAPWLYREPPVCTEVRSRLVESGSTQDLESILSVPGEYPPGRHHLVLCATVNGMLWCALRHIDVVSLK